MHGAERFVNLVGRSPGNPVPLPPGHLSDCLYARFDAMWGAGHGGLRAPARTAPRGVLGTRARASRAAPLARRAHPRGARAASEGTAGGRSDNRGNASNSDTAKLGHRPSPPRRAGADNAQAEASRRCVSTPMGATDALGHASREPDPPWAKLCSAGGGCDEVLSREALRRRRCPRGWQCFPAQPPAPRSS